VGRLFRLWFSLREPVSRRAYALSGFALMGLKYAAEALLVHRITGRLLTPLDYLNPLLGSRRAVMAQADWLLWVIVAWTLPFLWIGVTMTLRRAENAGVTPFLAVLYFVPVVNYILMIVLCLLPAHPRAITRPHLPPAISAHALRSALLGVALGVAIALAMVGLSVLAFGAYGTTLFVATPFVMGTTTAYVFNAAGARGMGATLLVASLAVVIAFGAIVLFALEGVVCLLMASPPALAMATMGACLGRAMALRPSASPGGLAAAVLPLPLLAGLEAARPAQPAVEVLTTIQIAAPRDVVWRHVVTFSELPAPPTWVYRLGVSYPQRATIHGRGVGAVRRCEFSTGAFVEPITAWQEPERLAFDVVAQPPPMEEWSPYPRVLAAHLNGYVRARKGEFRLRALPGGATLLEGRTFYEMGLFPADYWSLWTDALIHGIHRRVLVHIKSLSEASSATPM
jgi:hypothetical protein